MPEPDITISHFLKNRNRFPYLEKDDSGQKRIYLNSGAGSLMVDSCLKSIMATGSTLNPMPGDLTPPERATALFHQEVRQLIADFIGAHRPEEISFHFSSTNALFNLAFSLGHLFAPGKNCLITDLDHFANISPWETIASARGAEIRRVKLTPELDLDRRDLMSKLDAETVLVALPAASNALGTILPLTELIMEIKSRSRALVVVDAVHLAPHAPIDVREAGCDFLVFSGYKIFGPMLGVLYCREETGSYLKPYRVEPARDYPPYHLEQGMLPNLNLAGLKGALEYLLELGRTQASRIIPSSNRKLFRLALEAIKRYERDLSLYFLERWKRLGPGRGQLYGITQEESIGYRTPTFALEIPGFRADQLKKALWEQSRILIADGTHYSAVVVRHLRKEGLNRVSLAHYDGPETIDAFFDALEKIVLK